MDRFDCEDILELLSGYIDDEIDSVMKQLLEQHFKKCEQCLSLLHSLEKTIALSKEAHRRRTVPKKVVNRIYYEIRIRYKR